MFNYVDLLLLAIVLLSAWGGWHRGLLLGTLDLVRWVGSLLLAYRLYPLLAVWLEKHVLGNHFLAAPFAFFLVAVANSAVIQLLGMALLRKLPVSYHGHRANRALGVVPGFLSGVATAVIAAVLLLALPISDGLASEVQSSTLASRFGSAADRLETALAPVMDEGVARNLNKLTVEPEGRKTVELPFHVNNAVARPDLEAEMLEMLNSERQEAGLPPLDADTALRTVARLHSADMFRRGYFSHYTPENWDPFDRIKEHRVRFSSAGENLAYAQTLRIAHQGLMDSPGHRANILQEQFGRVGIGILSAGTKGLMITQNFRD